ncbi:hypothetical protein BH10ACT2_BH10ACT2_03160 [soil metagenome]
MSLSTRSCGRSRNFDAELPHVDGPICQLGYRTWLSRRAQHLDRGLQIRGCDVSCESTVDNAIGNEGDQTVRHAL